MCLDMLKKEIIEIGFDDAAFISPSQLELLPEIRGMCADNRCGAYGKKWTCPPFCGELDDCQKMINSYENAIIMISITKLEDSFDIEGMELGGKNQKLLFDKAVRYFREKFSRIIPMGAGGCTICNKCTCPESPCRFPEKAYTPMEAYGLFVSDVCTKCGVKYYNGEATVTYVSCIVF